MQQQDGISAPPANSRLDAYNQLDAYWQAVVNFITPHLKPEDRVIAPSPLGDCFPYGRCQSYNDDFSGKYQWVVLNKGMLVEAEDRGLIAACFLLEPVFANEVFVVFTTRNRMETLPEENVHYQSLLVLLENDVLPACMAARPSPSQLPAAHQVQIRPVIYMGNHRALIRTVHGQRMYINTLDLVSGPHLLLDGYWEPWVTDALTKNIREGATVIEVGANMGYYTLIAASKAGPGGKVISFEANPDLCALVFKSIEINGFLKHCEIINKAATDKAGTVTFQRWKEHTGLSTIGSYNLDYVKKSYDTVDQITVETVSLDDFLEARGILEIDVLKIDAEGSEPLIFKGLQRTMDRSKNLTVIFELNPMSTGMGLDLREMLTGFFNRGFTLQRIEHYGLVPAESVEMALSWPVSDILMQRHTPA